LYGEYEVIGHKELNEEEFEFPISYGKSLFPNQVVFLQWGLIHKELPNSIFNKYTVGEIQFHQNPYGYYSIGFSPAYDSLDIVKTIENNGVFKFDRSNHYKGRFDLRNPNNEAIKNEIQQSVSEYIPNLTINDISVVPYLQSDEAPGEINQELLGTSDIYKIPGKETQEYTAKLTIDYTDDNNSFGSREFIIINI
jgi:hypothetical protein